MVTLCELERTFSISGGRETVIGVDLGGSNVRAALGDAGGIHVAELAEETRGESAAAVLAQVTALCQRLAGSSWHDVRAVAVGVPGVVHGGAVDLAPNLPPFDGVNVRAALGEQLGVHVIVENDVNMATAGEHRRGHGVGVDDFVFVSVGTGIGMGIVSGGTLLRGAAGAAGEIGLLAVGDSTLEQVASGAGIAARFAAAATAQDVNAAADAGDLVAGAILAEQAEALARALMVVRSVLDPALVVFGGGIGSRPDVIARVDACLAGLGGRSLPLRASALGERAGVVGAAELAREQLLETVDA